MPQPTPYKTKSIEVIAFLRYKNHKLCGKKSEADGFNHAYFIDSEKLQKDVMYFFNNSKEKKLFDELRNAKQFLMDSEQ